MHILNSELALSAEHNLSQVSWQTLTASAVQPNSSFAEQLRQASEAQVERAPNAHSDKPSEVHKLQRQSWQSLLELLFGAQACRTQALSQAPTAAPSTTAAVPMKVEVQAMQLQTESCSFQSSGKVCLADGSERQFAVGYTLARSELNAAKISAELSDPLVLDLNGINTGFTAPMAFDLNRDGQAENLRLPSSPLLFLDQNGNGVADNGSELFGPRTGQGFAELAALDNDHNGWLDAGDSRFSSLNLWFAGQQKVQSLAQAGVGALSVYAASTPYQFKTGVEVLGNNVASSVWLGENSGAGLIRQVDVAVDSKKT
jgi:hypothetical protein